MVEAAWRLGPIHADVTWYAPGSRLRRHDHARPQVFIVVDGSLVEFSPEALLCGSGAAVFHPRSVEHSEEIAASGARCLNLEIDAAWLDGTVGAAAGRWDQPALLARHAGGMARRLRRGPGDASQPRAIDAVALVATLLAAGADGPTGRGAAGRGTADRAARWLAEHFADPVSTADAAAALGVNPSHLARCFRHRHGCSPGAYLRRLRVELACRLLERGGLTLSGVAATAGFADASHLSRAIRAATGATPGEIRRCGARPVPERTNPADDHR